MQETRMYRLDQVTFHLRSNVRFGSTAAVRSEAKSDAAEGFKLREHATFDLHGADTSIRARVAKQIGIV